VLAVKFHQSFNDSSMALLVQKFGGTSVGSVERIKSVAAWALDSQLRGDQVVLVVSAMSGETNRLVSLATEIHPIPFSREYDLLIASGEQIAVGLVTLAINAEAERRGLLKRGAHAYQARPFLGHQLGIRTDSVFSKARIQGIEVSELREEISRGVIPVIAGFQGVDAENNITTLGRGGSDTSAVAIAVALGADECEIYTDVDGVYTTDPRIVPKARKISKISYEEMMELASLGAKVLQIRSVELAAKYRMPLHVRSSFSPVEGTHVIPQDFLGKPLEQVLVAGVAADAHQVKFYLSELKRDPEVLASLFTALSDAAIVVDVIVQDLAMNQAAAVSFTVSKTDQLKTREVLDGWRERENPALKILEKGELSKVSIVGVGMQHHPGVASKMFQLLARAGVAIELITTSEIKISCLIDGSKTNDAVAALHTGFGLDAV
jgi:aspartate kinase